MSDRFYIVENQFAQLEGERRADFGKGLAKLVANVDLIDRLRVECINLFLAGRTNALDHDTWCRLSDQIRYACNGTYGIRSRHASEDEYYGLDLE